MRAHKVTIRNRDNVTLSVREDEAIFDVFDRAGVSLPIACKYGGCITCAAKLVSGKVRQPGATALDKRQSADGYILLCVARPTQDCIIDAGIESHTTLYRNPFLGPVGK